MLSKNLKYLRLKNNYSQDYIAKLLNKKSFTTVQKWESGVSEPPLWVVGKLAKLYGESLDTLANIDIEKRDDNIFTGQLSADTFDYTHVPVGIAAGALETCDGLTDLPTVNLPDFLLGKYARNKNIVIMHVNGESMNNVIQNGATIAVLTNVALENIHDGDIVIAATDEGEYTIKHYLDDEKNYRIILRPDSTDPTYTDLVFDYDEAQNLKIFGKVVIYSVSL